MSSSAHVLLLQRVRLSFYLDKQKDKEERRKKGIKAPFYIQIPNLSLYP